MLPDDASIPLAEYGSSNIGTMKTAYRRGLGHRYGRAMQTVAGIHYNFSLPDSFWRIEQQNVSIQNQKLPLDQYVSHRYFDLIRNFRRYYWLLIYLFSASPVADPSFVSGRPHNLKTLATGDLYLPDATSLRMGDLGYQSVAQKSLFVCYNEINTYIETLNQAIRMPYAHYEAFGTNVDGIYQQLSTALLQIENEFYSPIRPKRVTQTGETPLQALSRRGVEYIEVRCLDLNPLVALGIDETTIDFLDVFLITCLSIESPPCDKQEFALIGENQSLIVNQGRQPQLEIHCGKQKSQMSSIATEFLAKAIEVAEQLDRANNTQRYSKSVRLQQNKVNDPALTPSAQVFNILQRDNISHVEFALQQSDAHHRHHVAYKLDPKIERDLVQQAAASIEAQHLIEQNDQQSFSDFLKNYYAQSAKL